jgi:histidyl-tRNA synthetase
MVKKKNQSKKPQSLVDVADILPDTNYSWDLSIRRMQNLARSFGFMRVETPLLESAVGYHGDIQYGTTSDAIVEFTDMNEESVALRASMLPGVLRAYAEQEWPEGHLLSKWHYCAPVTTLHATKKKYEISWQYGFEVLGSFNSLIQAQLITLAVKVFQSVGIAQPQLEINTIGNAESRKDYEGVLRSFLKGRSYDLCEGCRESMDNDPLQIFRCPIEDCKSAAAEAPHIIDYLNDTNRKELTDILEALDEIGIPYAMNPQFAGAAGASGVVFRFSITDEQQREHVLGYGSGHAEIMEHVTGKVIPSFGFQGTLEQVRAAMQGLNLEIQHQDVKSDVYLVPLGDLASKKALRLFSELWDAEITVHDHFGTLGVKNQLKAAENAKASIALIIGQKEAMDEMVILRDVTSGMQEVFQYERIIDEVKKRLGK